MRNVWKKLASYFQMNGYEFLEPADAPPDFHIGVPFLRPPYLKTTTPTSSCEASGSELICLTTSNYSITLSHSTVRYRTRRDSAPRRCVRRPRVDQWAVQRASRRGTVGVRAGSPNGRRTAKGK
jgi:hypothetical protein